ncbi:MAG TPA: hypothetical protein VNT22_11685 [Baekduia sp.]|nr:hypothetical protein [Baekduia sp.]
MGDTVEALAHKTDISGRAMEKLDSAKHAITGAAPNADQIKGGTRRVAAVAHDNPLGMVAGAAAVGFLAGMALPSTKIEDERLGPVADRVKETAMETGQEALDRGKEVAESAMETLKEEGLEQAKEMRDSAVSNAQSTSPQM